MDIDDGAGHRASPFVAVTRAGRSKAALSLQLRRSNARLAKPPSPTASDHALSESAGSSSMLMRCGSPPRPLHDLTRRFGADIPAADVVVKFEACPVP
jgi:hypothetical protein